MLSRKVKTEKTAVQSIAERKDQQWRTNGILLILQKNPSRLCVFAILLPFERFLFESRKSNQISIVKLRPSSYLLAIKTKSGDEWKVQTFHRTQFSILPVKTTVSSTFYCSMQHDGFMVPFGALWLFPLFSLAKFLRNKIILLTWTINVLNEKAKF